MPPLPWLLLSYHAHLHPMYTTTIHHHGYHDTLVCPTFFKSLSHLRHRNIFVIVTRTISTTAVLVIKPPPPVKDTPHYSFLRYYCRLASNQTPPPPPVKDTPHYSFQRYCCCLLLFIALVVTPIAYRFLLCLCVPTPPHPH